MLAKILFATDLSPQAGPARDYCLQLARKTKAELLGVYALKSPAPLYGPSSLWEEHLQELRQVWEERLRSFFKEQEGSAVHVRTQVVTGAPEVAVHQLARKEKVDLLVVGKNSRSALERFFVGSTTEKLLREAQRPVLVLPEKVPSPPRWQPLLCAVDFSSPSKKALEFAIRLVENYGGQLVVAHVAELDSSMRERLGSQLSQLLEPTARKLEEMVSTFGAPQDSRVLLLSGKPSATLLAQARELDADLLVLGSRGHWVKKGMGLGSTAHALLREAHLPFLVVPS